MPGLRRILYPSAFNIPIINRVGKEAAMSVVNNADDIFHRIRVKLRHNYLPSLEGSYVARTKNEAALSIENVCASMKNIEQA